MENPEFKQNTTPFNPFSGSEIEKVIHTTQAQDEIWTSCKLGGDDANRAYNESISIYFEGELNIDHLEKAVNHLVNRHESLRAVFSTNGQFMTVFKNLKTILFFKDATLEKTSAANTYLNKFINNEANYVFNLVKGPLIKFGLIKTATKAFTLVITAHHIICDGWSLGIFLQELGVLYSAYNQNNQPELPKSVNFSDYADDNSDLIESDSYNTIENYWINTYKSSIPNYNLPTDYYFPKSRSYASKRLDFSLSKEALNLIKQCGLNNNSSLVTTLLAAFEVFVFKVTGETDITIGLPAAGQSVTGMQQLIGHCVNLLPLRAKLTNNQTFTEYLIQRKSTLFDAYEHQQLSFGHLLKKIPIPRNPSRVPLVPIVFNIDLGMTNGVNFNNLTYKLKSNPRTFETFEIFLNASGNENNLVLEWSYNTSIFKEETIKSFMQQFEAIIELICLKPNQPLHDIFSENYLEAYHKLNATTSQFSTDVLPYLLQKQAEKSAKNIALSFNNEHITYQDLFLKANQLTHYLIEQGVKAGDFVGVCINRNSNLLPTLIAILQSGAAYIPLDTKYPQDRIEFMLNDSKAKFLITSISLNISTQNELKVITLNDALKNSCNHSKAKPNIKISQNDYAYVLYTSGSTGKPKGVSITHKNLINLLLSISEKPGITESDKMLAITTISFDISLVELFLPLLNGASIVLAHTKTTRDGNLLLKLIKKEQVSIIQATPTTWSMLIEAGWNNKLEITAFCGGEALSSNLALQIINRCKSLWNMYGPTETTIYSIITEITKTDTQITIGKPINNTEVYILNKENHLMPPNVIGEIAIAGLGVSNGYFNRNELTTKQFINTNYSESKLYKTGDLGKLLPNGEILCLGRIDNQVKIRGHRIELGEIEQVLSQNTEINSAIVIVNNDRLIAFVKPEKTTKIQSAAITTWKQYLESKLPAYLVPQEINMISNFPKTPNGKIDRNALQKISSSKNESQTNVVSPQNETEKLLAKIWQKHLKINRISITSNFFELGGHSLIALKVMNDIKKEIDKELPISSLFEYPTIETFSKLITDSKTKETNYPGAHNSYKT